MQPMFDLHASCQSNSLATLDVAWNFDGEDISGHGGALRLLSEISHYWCDISRCKINIIDK